MPQSDEEKHKIIFLADSLIVIVLSLLVVQETRLFIHRCMCSDMAATKPAIANAIAVGNDQDAAPMPSTYDTINSAYGPMADINAGVKCVKCNADK